MQHSDNDMDELFRKAADKYPLKTGVKNWEDVSPFIASTAAVAVVPAKKYKRMGTALFLICCIMAAALITADLTHQHRVSANRIAGKDKKQPPETNTQISPAPQNNAVTDFVYPIIAKVKNKPLYPAQRTGKTNIYNGIPEELINLPVHQIPAAIIHPSNFAALKQNSPLIKQNITNPSDLSKTYKSEKNKKTGLYIGLQAGLQLNEVKGQGFNKPGFSAGFTGGISLSKRFSVETGIAWSQRYFFTDGKYFDMGKAGAAMPSNMTLISMNSSSHIFEVPVSLKYNIATLQPAGWFFTAGFNSFILTKESNHYLAVINGQQQNEPGNYNTHKSYFFAAAQFSAGYQYTLQKQIRLRIEPYVQIPLKGMGIGEVQVMTAGIHLGVFRQAR